MPIASTSMSSAAMCQCGAEANSGASPRQRSSAPRMRNSTPTPRTDRMRGLADLRITAIRIEATVEQQGEHGDVALLGGLMKCDVVRVGDLFAQRGVRGKHRLRRGAITSRTGGDQPIHRLEIVGGALRAQP